MKKLLFIGLAVIAGMTANAQVAARSYKFIPGSISTLIVSNTIAITNIGSVSSAWSTNKAGTAWTNSAGTGVVAGQGDKVRLLQDVPLWALRDGSGAWVPTTNAITGIQGYATLAVTSIAGSGANAAVTFVFAPVYGDKEGTSATDIWTIAFTPTASTVQTVTTNVPMYKWPGASALRLSRIVNADTDASSSFTVTDISLNGFVPQ
jgi:hypothetical protein